MSNFKFNIDPKEPREEQIARHKDFSKVMHNYQRMTHPLYRTPLYRYSKVLLAVAFALFVAWMVVEFGEEPEDKKNPKTDSVKPIKKDSVEMSPQTKMIEKETLKPIQEVEKQSSSKPPSNFIESPKK